MDKHEENCQNHDAITIVLPEKGSILEFKNHKHYQKHEPSGFCFHVKCLDKYSEPILLTKTREEENVADIFVDMLKKEIDQAWSSEVKEMIF